MKTEAVLNRLTNEVGRPTGDHVSLPKAEAKLLLDRISTLESLASALLRLAHESTERIDVVLPYRNKPAV